MVVQMPVRELFRLRPRVSPLTLVRRSSIAGTAGVKGGTRVYDTEIGPYSYVGRLCLLQNVDIGSFTSIADNVAIGLPKHSLSWVSTSPVFGAGPNVLKKNFADHAVEPIQRAQLGHDVWVGLGAIVLGGITIHTGAVIGAGAVVTKNVPPYAVAVGNPAHIVRYRFDESTIRLLLDSRWWTLSETTLRRAGAKANDVLAFVQACQSRD